MRSAGPDAWNAGLHALRRMIVLAALLAAPIDGHAQTTNLALGRPVNASSFESTSYPTYAVDGDASLSHWWGANPYPQWLEVDLQAVGLLERVRLFTYWDGSRSYQYTVEASVDGVGWSRIVDRSGNTTPSTAAGFTHGTPGVKARFIRVNMLKNSANPGVHIVELEVLGTASPAGELEVVPAGPISFAAQDVYAGATSPTKVVIRNTDPTHSLTLSAVGLSGPNAADFEIFSDSAEATVAPNAARTLEIAFDPAQTGARKAFLTVHSNDLDEGEKLVTLVGRGAGEVFPLIPQSAATVPLGGTMTLSSNSRIRVSDPRILPHAEVLAGELYLVTGIRLPIALGTPQPGDVALQFDHTLGEEEYGLQSTTSVIIRGRDVEAIARGTASLVQLVAADGTVPGVRLHDAPAFAYRALSLDVARKYHSVEVLKHAIEMCRLYKIRYFGLHLTDDQNFMFPSTAFPNLDQNNFDQPAYTLSELHELEQYAVDRGVAIVPELDVPGHSAKLVQLYPQVFGSLSGGTIDFQLPSCVAGVKTLITEMTDVFSSTPLFHIGGDESGFSHLPAFATFVGALNDHVKAGGRTTLIWEGFGPGAAVPKDILVLNWESSYYPPDAMLQAGYSVVNAGWDPLYVVDHYPWVQYTYHTQERLFDFDPFTFRHVAPGYPTSDGITVPPTSRVLGAEMCWWEGRGDYALPILRNRVPPLAARLWNPVGETSFASFEDRFEAADLRLESILFPVRVSARDVIRDDWKPEQSFANATVVRMESSLTGTIRFTADGSEPNPLSPTFSGPLALAGTTTIKAALYQGSERIGFTTRVGFLKVQTVANLTTGKAVTSDSPAFIENPPELAVDGVVEKDSYWTCFPSPASLTIDLGAVRSLDGATVFSHWGSGYSERYSVDLSVDGRTWTPAVDFTANTQAATASGYAHSFAKTPARYLRVNAAGNSWFPDGRFPRIVEVRAHEAP